MCSHEARSHTSVAALLVAMATQTGRGSAFRTASHVAPCLDTAIFSSWAFLNLSQQTNLEANTLFVFGNQTKVISKGKT